MQCTIRRDAREWQVTVADVTVARAPELVTAILEAFGGLLDRDTANELADAAQLGKPAAGPSEPSGLRGAQPTG